MATLRSKGIAPATDSEVATQGYVNSVRGTASLTQTAINTQVSAALLPYADASYVATRDLLNASVAQVDAGDATKLKASTINALNGVAGLDATGRIGVARVPGTSTQRWPRGFYTPASYQSTTVASISGIETTVFTQALANPGFPFRLLVSGQLNVRTATDGDAPVVRVRVGSTAGPIIATATASPSQYRYGVDTFNRTVSSLGAGWEQFYTGSGSGHTETTSKAFWVTDGNDPNRKGFFRKISDFATTVDDYQEVFYRVADACESGGLFGSDPHNRLYGRVNATRSSYIAFDMTDTTCSLIYASGGTEASLVAPQSGFTQGVGDEILAQFGYYAGTNKRRFRLVHNGTVKIDYTDTGQVTAMSTDNRGWGFGHQAGSSLLFGQSKPAALDWIALNDPIATWSADPENYSVAVLTSIDLSSQPSLVGDQTLYVTLDATSTATVYASNPDLAKFHAMVIPA
jgi:hypothetical protein